VQAGPAQRALPCPADKSQLTFGRRAGISMSQPNMPKFGIIFSRRPVCKLPFALAGWLAALPGVAPAQTTNAELHTVAEVRGMTAAEAQEHRAVRLRGVVTFFDEGLFSRFLQDETSGVYLYDAGLPIHLTPGQVVEVTGTTSSGEYAPIVVPREIRVVGQGPLPAPRRVGYEDMASGMEDSQFVEVSGVVRSVEFDATNQYYLIEIATGGGRLSVYARSLPVDRVEALPDSKVRVRGVCSTQFNHRRQLFAIRLMVPRAEDFVMETPAPASPYAITPRPIGSLLQFTPQESFGRRVKVAGTVIYAEPGKELFLQEGDQGVEVQSKGREALALGDRIEALGFVSQGDYTPLLQDAIYHKLAAGPPLPPLHVTPDEALNGKYDCQLIQVTANVLDRAMLGTDHYLVLQEGNAVFQAFLGDVGEADPLARLENGSRVAVTGVCRIEPGAWLAGDNWRAKAFRLQMRSIADVELVQAPSWWTLRRVLGMAITVGVAALAAFGWVVVLRRQVAERGRELEIQIQERQLAERRREIEQERTRVAQDLHDELGATLTEVSMLGSLVKTPSLPPETRELHLEKLVGVSRAVVATLDEIVWAVNPKYDSVASLASYYSLFAQRFLNLAGMACRLTVADTFPAAPLESRLRHGVFLAFKEALNNAVRHSGASQVHIEMKVAAHTLRIAITDNGSGFDVNLHRPGSDGVAGMQDRMTRLGGQCEISSVPRQGTTVVFSLPLGKPDK